LTCRDVLSSLDAFLDDELPGAGRLAISEHLTRCDSSAAERAAISGLGEALRLESGYTGASEDLLGGLVGSVLSRTRAEQAQSWRALWNRAFEDWHWVAVGAGSVAGAFLSLVLASAMLSSSIDQAMKMNARTGTLYVMALPHGGRGAPVMMEFEERLGAVRSDATMAMPASFGWQAERALVSALDESMVRSGRPASLRGLSDADRDEILALLSEITELRYQEPSRRPGGLTNISGMHLVVSTSVVASVP
jgi:hypothetical protein